MDRLGARKGVCRKVYFFFCMCVSRGQLPASHILCDFMKREPAKTSKKGGNVEFNVAKRKQTLPYLLYVVAYVQQVQGRKLINYLNIKKKKKVHNIPISQYPNIPIF